MLICPLCTTLLTKNATSYVCPHWHSFDIAKQWYVNLLVGSKKVWDDHMMLKARKDFLETELYQPLIDYVATHIKNNKSGLTIADIGCGEWWYMRALQTIRDNSDDTYIGMDVSKDAVKLAAKQTLWIFAVWNAYDIPLQEESVDVLISIFSPWNEKEMYRCVKKWGIALVVSPGKDHLYRFIEMIRDNPHKHITKTAQENFSLLSIEHTQEVSIDLHLSRNKTIQDLFKMTPYYRKAPKTKQEKILALDVLDTKAHFAIDVLKKA